MKILYVTDGVAPYVIGGMQTIARGHIFWLAEAGHEVFVVVPAAPPMPVDALPATLVPIPWRKRSLRDAINPWRYVHDLEDYGRAVAERVKNVRPDVVYSEGPLVSALLDQPNSHHAPIVFHPHGLEAFQDWGTMANNAKVLPLRGIVARHSRFADFVISYDGRLDDLLAQRIGTPPQRIRRLRNTAATAITESAARDRHGAGFLFVGRDDPRKGLPQLFKAISAIPEALLDVVGIARTKGALPPNVTLRGQIRDPEVLARFYREADFLVVPSFAEGMPTVILEAFAQGLPVIASDVGAVAGAVVEGRTGFLVRPGDVAGLIAAMRKAVALSDADYRAMSGACLAAIASEFSPDSVRTAFLGIVDEAFALGNKVSQGR